MIHFNSNGVCVLSDYEHMYLIDGHKIIPVEVDHSLFYDSIYIQIFRKESINGKEPDYYGQACTLTRAGVATVIFWSTIGKEIQSTKWFNEIAAVIKLQEIEKSLYIHSSTEG